MIKTGQPISGVINDFNKELSAKVSKSRTVAGVPLYRDIAAKDLLENLFVIGLEINGTTLFDVCKNWANDKDWSADPWSENK